MVHLSSGPALTVAEVAARLQVSTATVYALCDRGELAHFRVLNSIRVPFAAVDAFLVASANAPTRRRVRKPRDPSIDSATEHDKENEHE